MYAHSCSRYLVHKVESHLARSTITFAAHGKTGAVPWNTIPEEERTSVVAFIKNYADRFGLPQPSAPHGHNKPAPIYLPCHTTKLLLHSDYIQAGGEVSYTTFRRIWKVACPDIVINSWRRVSARSRISRHTSASFTRRKVLDMSKFPFPTGSLISL